MDERSEVARRLRDVRDDLIADRGGPDHVSSGERLLIEHVALAQIQLETMKSKALAGEQELDIDAFGQLADRQRRWLVALGLKRAMKDAAPSLDEYLATKGAGP